MDSETRSAERDPAKVVVLVSGSDRRELVRLALTELGEAFTRPVKQAREIFIHPNLVSHGNPKACTSSETVRGVIDHISLLRSDVVTVGDASYHGTKKAFEQLGYETLRRSGNIVLIDLNDDDTVESFAYDANLKKRPVPFSKTVANAHFNIVVVPAKMHSYYTVSLSIKTHIVGSMIVRRSPFGNYARWPYLHTGYKQAHLTLSEVYTEHPAQLSIIDGTEAMEGDGPIHGEIVKLGWLIASRNPVAADALAAYLMGFEPREIGYLCHLTEEGFGPIELRDMIVVGDPPKKLRRTLKRPSSFPEITEWH